MNGSFANHVFMDVTILKYKLVKKNRSKPFSTTMILEIQ